MEVRANVDKTPDAILTFAVKCAQEAWQENQQPYLLSRLSPDLTKVGVNYKDILGEQRLKDFIRGASDRIKVVTHPSQKSKIGLIPPDMEFEYDATSALIETKAPPPSSFSGKGGSLRRSNVVSNFLQLLSELDETDAAQVQIPTHILTKLLRDR